MPSCRVRRGSVYVPIADNFNTTTNRASVVEGQPPLRTSSRSPSPRGDTQNGSLNRNKALPRPPLDTSPPPRRNRSSTLASIFGSTSAGDDTPGTSPTESRIARGISEARRRSNTVRSTRNALTTVEQNTIAVPNNAQVDTSPEAREDSAPRQRPTGLLSPQEAERPQSWVMDSIMQSRWRRGSVSVRAPPDNRNSRPQLLDVFEDTRRRSGSIVSAGSAGVEVSLELGDNNRSSRIATAVRARSPPRSPSPARSEASFVDDEHHLDEVVDHLDVIDPSIATVSHLSNAANSILIPPLSLYSRKPVVTLPTLTPVESEENLTAAEKALKEPKDELDRHVQHVFRRRDKLRRTLRGVWAFLKTPIGIITAIYGFLVAFWGAAIVVFLVRIINFHNSYRQKLWIEIASQVENGLFTLTGVGLIPWRALDTYRIYRIWNYKRLTHKLRKKAGLPYLENEDDLPDPAFDPNYVHVLTDKQQDDLHYQQQKFMESQTWYRPHATDTHRAFPISTALLICCLVDGNSIFQCMLCGVMWGLNRFNRPAWTTGVLIPASFLCGIFSAVFIARGGSKTKKTKEVEDILRSALEKGERSGDNDGNHVDDEPPIGELKKKRSGAEVPTPTQSVSTGHERKEKSEHTEPILTITTFGGPAGHIP